MWYYRPSFRLRIRLGDYDSFAAHFEWYASIKARSSVNFSPSCYRIAVDSFLASPEGHTPWSRNRAYDMLYDNAINAEEDVTTKRGRMNSKITNKQKRALHDLTGFLNVDPAADVQLKKRNRPADSDDNEDSLPDEPTARRKLRRRRRGKVLLTLVQTRRVRSLFQQMSQKAKKGTQKGPAKKGDKKGNAASKKKGGQAKVKPFSNTTVHTPALEKKLNHRGDSKGDDKRRSTRARKT